MEHGRPIQIMQRLPQGGFYQAQARSGPAIATTSGDQIHVALRSSVQGDDTLRTTTLSAGQTDFRGVKWTELRTGLTNASPALLTDNIGIPRLVIRGLDNAPWYASWRNGAWSGFTKFSNDQLASAPGLYRNSESQIRFYGASPSNQIISRPVLPNSW
ncbi:hypothetical protein ACQPYH_22910 [Kribbella sp. CA-245084]|uniref:hypothetical protein n=1 Tax=Kribbella sp. CA-245084 TaxID=3239940 RepID=UPI003D93BF24